MKAAAPFVLLSLFTLHVSLFFSAAISAQMPSTDSGGFRYAVPGYIFEFPRDHGSHPEYRTEWWYYTGHLRTASGKRYGFEVTFFRVGIDPAGAAATTRWDLRHVGLAHFALTDLSRKEFRYYEKLNRHSPFLAGAREGSLGVFNENWRVTTQADGSFRLRASAEGDAIDLKLMPLKPPAIHGRDGVSVKAEGLGYASHYYSMTRMRVEGTLTSRGVRESATGLAWMDHEFGSSSLRETQVGWDWLSLQLDNGNELMLYIIRKKDGTADTTSSGSIVTNDGSVIPLRHDEFRLEPRGSWKSPRSGATYPMGWRVKVVPFGIDLLVTETLKDQELVTSRSTNITYWEGLVDAAGQFGGTAVRGAGYVELTGYDKPVVAP